MWRMLTRRLGWCDWRLISDRREPDGPPFIVVRVRRWHPGFWWFAGRMAWRDWHRRQGSALR